MHAQLLDYLMDNLDAAGRLRVETRLQVDPEARRQLEALQRALEPLAADAELVPPPALAARTVARVASHICTELPRAPTIARPDGLARPWWRRADVLVAASLLLTFLGLGVPALLKLRTQDSAAAIADCSNNLLEFYVGLKAYEDVHGKLPVISEKTPRDVAGMVVPVLKEAKVLPATFSVRCPGHGPFQACSTTLAELQALPAAQFAREAPKLLVSYAYSLGYRDEQGTWHAVSRLGEQADANVPLLADTPPAGAAPGNSPNHASRGQNVLYLDGHVRFLTLRTLGGDDLFLNRANRVAAGLDANDAVLGYSEARP
jgi:prepilin-type processing-associated H-X9-DG protein